MNAAVKCLRCDTQMEAGFMIDATHSGFQQQNWYAGEPTPSFWMGLKLEKDSVIPVTTLRCPKCGYLESYALPSAASDKS